MKTVNRGYILVEPLQPFCDWAKEHDADFDFNEDDDIEGTVYLIDEDFFEIEPVIEQHFKKIMHNECAAVTDDEAHWPKPSMELFLAWFTVRIGGTVFDTQKSDLIAD
ncbi:MAG: hypothetical protein V4604_15450 [Bacteroidota bacterium]